MLWGYSKSGVHVGLELQHCIQPEGEGKRFAYIRNQESLGTATRKGASQLTDVHGRKHKSMGKVLGTAFKTGAVVPFQLLDIVFGCEIIVSVAVWALFYLSGGREDGGAGSPRLDKQGPSPAAW